MDHLPLPHEPVVGFTRIPFLITEPFDENGRDFLTFLPRHGWDIRGLPGKASVKRDGVDASIAETGAMLQTWACLELASAFMGQRIDHECLKAYRQDNVYLSTKALGEQIAAWSETAVQQEVFTCRDKLEIWRNERYDYIQQARHVVLQIQPTEKYLSLDAVCMSLAAVGEFLVQVIKDICFNGDIKQPMRLTWRVPPRVDCGRPILETMWKAGWCPNKIARLEASTYMPVGKLWYLAHTCPPSTKDHRSCEASQCLHLHVEKSSYRLAHTRPDCDCQLCGPNQDQVIDILNHEAIPVLRVLSSPDGELGFQVEPGSPEVPYVAISHVWADGHGNPYENKIPQCFLDFLVSLVQSLPDTPARFWIDTLCVPLEPHAMRKKAITLLRDTYKRANMVLVLDSFLMSLDSADMDAIEIVARISCCGWAERLWTFQEGRLGRRILFQFRDRAVDPYFAVDFVWRGNFRRIPSIPSHSVDLAVISHYTSTTLLETVIMRGLLTMIPMVRNSLCARSTTNEADEAICLANIMGLDVGRIYDSPDANRMEAFWSQLQEIPVGLAFSTATRKLCQPGFRWAPASLMGDLNNTLWVGPDACSRDFSARALSSGLVVTLSSFRIATVAEASLNRKSAMKHLMAFGTADAFPLRDEHGTFYNCVIDGPWHPKVHEARETDQLAILLACHPVDFRSMAGSKHEFNPEWVEEGILISSPRLINELEPVPAKGLCHVRLVKVGAAYQALFATFREYAERFMRSKEYTPDSVDLRQCMVDVANFMRGQDHGWDVLKRFEEFERFQPSEEDYYGGIASLVCQWPFWAVMPGGHTTWCLD